MINFLLWHYFIIIKPSKINTSPILQGKHSQDSICLNVIINVEIIYWSANILLAYLDLSHKCPDEAW